MLSIVYDNINQLIDYFIQSLKKFNFERGFKKSNGIIFRECFETQIEFYK